MRLDRYLVEKGYATSREKARRLIEEGRVQVSAILKPKPSTPVDEEVAITVREPLPFVGRGGEKLSRALEEFGISPDGAHCLDVGASTGGFTDCLLQQGAARVVAVDVGHGQMDPTLSKDPRVRSFEGVNARELDPVMTGPPCDLIVVDLSFISLEKIVPGLVPHLREGGCLLCLVKPQFEAGRQAIGKGGIVRDPRVHRSVLAGHVSLLAACRLHDIRLARSFPPGRDGNVEFWSYSLKLPSEASGRIPGESDILALVSKTLAT